MALVPQRNFYNKPASQPWKRWIESEHRMINERLSHIISYSVSKFRDGSINGSFSERIFSVLLSVCLFFLLRWRIFILFTHMHNYNGNIHNNIKSASLSLCYKRGCVLRARMPRNFRSSDDKCGSLVPISLLLLLLGWGPFEFHCVVAALSNHSWNYPNDPYTCGIQ